MFEFLKQWWQGDSLSEDEYVRRRAQLLGKAPIPTFWLLGKTGSGKSSIIRYLTGVESAEIGNGYRPQTKTSQRYDFPDSKDPLMTFLDTRGLGEAGYDPTEDLESFSDSTQLVLVTGRVLDHALDELIASLKTIRAAAPERPILLALTCLHETVPGSDISERDLFTSEVPVPGELPDDLKRSLQHQIELFAGLADAVVPIDLTQPAEGFAHPNFGGDRLKAAILELLPSSYRQTLLHLEELVSPLKSLQQRRAQSAILSASTIAGTAAAVPLPWVDIPVVFAIQTHLAYRLAAIYELELTTAQWAQLTGVAGGRIAVGMAVREMLKVIPWVGMAANAAAAFAYTFATGMAWNWYFLEVKQGHVPSADELQKVFQEQLSRGAALWKETDQQPASSEEAPS
ncbi:MAG: DUF697 domain-containing protein [Planctomycetaceae bacterium]|nr:DUF697 domain-containing protein [Planctomycetaceae bacterium]